MRRRDGAGQIPKAEQRRSPHILPLDMQARGIEFSGNRCEIWRAVGSGIREDVGFRITELLKAAWCQDARLFEQTPLPSRHVRFIQFDLVPACRK